MIYLRKAIEPGVVNWCECAQENALAVVSQASCPWCGCGYLWSCITCRNSFTIAEAVEVPLTFDEIRELDARGFFGEERRPPGMVKWRNEASAFSTENLVLGAKYVYLDGSAHDVRADGLHFRGRIKQHSLRGIPHITAPSADDLIAAFERPYWQP